jgi:two-component system phosphate regulon response regulator PhoB
MSEKLPPKILVIDTDEILRASVCSIIERYWFMVCRASDEQMAIQTFISEKPNIVIISSRLHGITALEMSNKLRNLSYNKIAIIFLIDPNENIAVYQKRDMEFNEYLVRPYNSSELMLTIKRLLRRSQPIYQDRMVQYKDIILDLMTFQVFRLKTRLTVGPIEFKILSLFFQSPQTIFSRKQIIDYVWGVSENVEERTVDVHINRLRKIITNTGDSTQGFIKTVRSAGYCLSLPGEII